MLCLKAQRFICSTNPKQKYTRVKQTIYKHIYTHIYDDACMHSYPYIYIQLYLSYLHIHISFSVVRLRLPPMIFTILSLQLADGENHLVVLEVWIALVKQTINTLNREIQFKPLRQEKQLNSSTQH